MFVGLIDNTLYLTLIKFLNLLSANEQSTEIIT